MINAAVFGIVILVSFIAGVFSLLGYMLWRMMRNDGWDDSNVTNPLRVLSHVVLHKEDFGKMYYVSDYQRGLLKNAKNPAGRTLKRPFWYISEDEFEGVVKTRP